MKGMKTRLEVWKLEYDVGVIVFVCHFHLLYHNLSVIQSSPLFPFFLLTTQTTMHIPCIIQTNPQNNFFFIIKFIQNLIVNSHATISISI